MVWSFAREEGEGGKFPFEEAWLSSGGWRGKRGVWVAREEHQEGSKMAGGDVNFQPPQRCRGPRGLYYILVTTVHTHTLHRRLGCQDIPMYNPQLVRGKVRTGTKNVLVIVMEIACENAAPGAYTRIAIGICTSSYRTTYACRDPSEKGERGAACFVGLDGVLFLAVGVGKGRGRGRPIRSVS